MTKDEILEGNKLIADFMGDEFNANGDNVYPKGSYGCGGCYLVENLRYNYSWDWLMPVVEKIIEIDIKPAPNWEGYRVEIIPRGYVKITGFPMPPIFKNVCKEGSLINAVWLAVVEFIKWHNKNKTDESK